MVQFSRESVTVSGKVKYRMSSLAVKMAVESDCCMRIHLLLRAHNAILPF